MGKRLRGRGTFAPGAGRLQGERRVLGCRSTRFGCKGGNLGIWCLLGSHRAVRRSGGAPTGGGRRVLGCRSTRVGCEGGNLGSWCLLGSHRGRCSYRGSVVFWVVGAPVSGAIWGGAFGRAGHAVRTGGGAPTGGRRVLGL